MDIFDHLLRAAPPREAVPSLDVWFGRLAECPFELPVDRALWSGFEADRLGYAFAGGYREALTQLFASVAKTLGRTEGQWPTPPLPARLSLAATEASGAHPRAIEARLEGAAGAHRVHGVKTYATLASIADELLVVASRGVNAEGKNRLRLVRVNPYATGVAIRVREPPPFAPEIPHAVVTMTDVVVRDEDILPGDAYAFYLKPFRTLEDAHVLASTLGYVIRVARTFAFERALVEGLYAVAVGLRTVAILPPSSPTTHLALAGLFQTARRFVGEHDAEWDKADAETKARFRRDVGLLMVAENARQKRTESAWAALTKT